jgi:Putative zinc-finger
VKCSLLTLSTFIDGELAPPRRAEVDAHLVGCTRCSAGAATLREEKVRVGQLARVTVDPGSAQLMLEQVGITLETVVDRSPVIPPPPSAPPDVRRPWQGGESGRALPWTPRRPEPAPLGGEPITVPTVPDVQRDLPLDGMRSEPASWDTVVEDDPPLSPVVKAAADTAITAPDSEWVEADDEWLNAATAPDSWEEDLPPAVDATPPPMESWGSPDGLAAPVTATEFSTAPPAPMHTPPPTRLAAASGPAALWTRVRDAVTVRLALARGGDALEDSLEIVSGAPAARRAELPTAARPSMPDALAHGTAPPPQVPPEPSSEVELNGVAGHARPGPSIEDLPSVRDVPAPEVDRRIMPPAEMVDERPAADAEATAGWNAFAASSYPDVDVPVDDRPPAVRPQPIGRHTRAVAREQVHLSTRMVRGVTALAAATRVGTATAVARVRQSVSGLSRTGPDSRLLAGIAGIGLIFVIALLIGHGSGHPAAPTAARASTVPSAHSQPPAPARSSAAASAGGASAPAHVQTFGAGDTGFQVIRLRYGAQTGYMRVVFDLGAARGTATGTPKATVSYSNPTTVLVTLSGTVPAGSTGTPTPGKVISSVTLVSSSGNKTVYRFGLTRAATATAFYLISPTRFVLDLH